MVRFTCAYVHHSRGMARYITHVKAPVATQFRENVVSFATQIEGNASFATQIEREFGAQRHNTEPAIYPGNKPRHPLCGNGWRNNLDPNPPSPKSPQIKILSSITPIFLGKNLEPFFQRYFLGKIFQNLNLGGVGGWVLGLYYFSQLYQIFGKIAA
jgi:hypothetical protein